MECLKGTRTTALWELLSDFLVRVTEVQSRRIGTMEAGDPGTIYEMQPLPCLSQGNSNAKRPLWLAKPLV